MPSSAKCEDDGAQAQRPGNCSPSTQGRHRFLGVTTKKAGIKEVDDGIWLASFMPYDLGCFDLEQKTLQPLDNPFGTRLSPLS